jgi:hypothetical protein
VAVTNMEKIVNETPHIKEVLIRHSRQNAILRWRSLLPFGIEHQQELIQIG